MTLRRRINQIAGLTFIAIIGGCVAAYPIEDRRIGNFCTSLTPGIAADSAKSQAQSMFGTEVHELQPSGDFMVRSRFTFKTLCLVSVAGQSVKSANFSND
jgi:hypothetical protein